MNLYKTVTHLMALTLTLLVGLGSIEGLMAADQTPRERQPRRRGLGKRSLRRGRRAEPPAEDAAHAGIEMGEDSLVIEIAYTDRTKESILLPHFFNQLYKTPCHYTYQNCNCFGILPHKTLGDIEVATIYTYNTETRECRPHPEFTEKFAAVLDEVNKDFWTSQLIGGILWCPVPFQFLYLMMQALDSQSSWLKHLTYMLSVDNPNCISHCVLPCCVSCCCCLCKHCNSKQVKNAYLAQFRTHFIEEDQ